MSIYIPGCLIVGVILDLFLGPPFLWGMSLLVASCSRGVGDTERAEHPQAHEVSPGRPSAAGPSALTTHCGGNSTPNSLPQCILHVVLLTGSSTHQLSVWLLLVPPSRSKRTSHQQPMSLRPSRISAAAPAAPALLPSPLFPLLNS